MFLKLIVDPISPTVDSLILKENYGAFVCMCFHTCVQRHSEKERSLLATLKSFVFKRTLAGKLRWPIKSHHGNTTKN